MIGRAMKDFRILTAYPKTPAERRRSLLSVVSKAKALQEAIAADPLAKGYAKQLVAIHLARKNLKHRRDEGEIPSWDENEKLYPALRGDCRDAARNKEIRSYDFGNWWMGRGPTVMPAAFWAREAKDTGLHDILQLLVESLEEEASFSPDIRQPGRRDQALKGFLIGA